MTRTLTLAHCAAANGLPGDDPNQTSIWFNPEDLTGVRGTYGFFAGHVFTSAVVCAARLSGTIWISFPACGLTAFSRKRQDARAVPVRLALDTSPVAMFSAATKWREADDNLVGLWVLNEARSDPDITSLQASGTLPLSGRRQPHPVPEAGLG